jgi:predicted neutral ceramidase superfamily lipid hydrolase
MKNTQPTWPQTLLICAFAAAFCFLGYFLSRMRNHWGPSAWLILAFLVLVGMGFILALFFYYLRPQYGVKAFPVFLAMILGHATLVAVLLKMGLA